MSNWPALLAQSASGFPGVAAFEAEKDHSHVAEDILGGTLSGVLIEATDIWSSNWDGSIPADLSGGPDSGATAGYYLDDSAGRVQVLDMFAGVSGADYIKVGFDSVGSLPTVEFFKGGTREGQIQAEATNFAIAAQNGRDLSLVAAGDVVSDSTFLPSSGGLNLGSSLRTWRDLFVENIKDENGTLRWDLSGNINIAGTTTLGSTLDFNGNFLTGYATTATTGTDVIVRTSDNRFFRKSSARDRKKNIKPLKPEDAWALIGEGGVTFKWRKHPDTDETIWGKEGWSIIADDLPEVARQHDADGKVVGFDTYPVLAAHSTALNDLDRRMKQLEETR